MLEGQFYDKQQEQSLQPTEYKVAHSARSSTVHYVRQPDEDQVEFFPRTHCGLALVAHVSKPKWFVSWKTGVQIDIEGPICKRCFGSKQLLDRR